jgi:uncharacterized protein (UPF0332 family)
MIYELEIEALLVKAKRSLSASKNLMERGDYDFSISRAYYSMFYCAEALLLTKDMKFSKHSAVISYFGREFVKSGLLSRELYDYLLKGFRERQIGDYETLNLPLFEEAKELTQDAKIFLETTEMYLRKVGYKFKDIDIKYNYNLIC